MITMTTLGSNGRLGNQIMQYMAMMGLSIQSGQELQMPGWRYEKYFKLRVNKRFHITDWIHAHEHQFHYDKNFHNHLTDGGNYDVKGYFQTKKYWEHYEEEIRSQFKWESEFYDHCRFIYKELFKKETIAIHIRRGDYVNHRSYHNLHINYYINALREISRWREMNVLIFSDDPGYCKVHFACLENALVMEGNSDIEDLCLMSMCDHFILSNSSFAWCGAYLSGKPGTNITRPAYHFKGAYADSHNAKDFWPSDWTCYNHITQEGYLKKIPLQDMTFVIPFFNDSVDRVENLTANLHQLLDCFDTNIMIGEQGPKTITCPNVQYMGFETMKTFHRTKMLNDMIKAARTMYVANWDADVFIPPMQILESVHQLRQGVEIVYPYGGTFNRLERNPWYKILMDSNDLGCFANSKFPALQSKGGAVFYYRKSFMRAGMENENMINFGPEDAERLERFTTLELNIQRTKGELYHLEHFRGVNSGKRHPHIDFNRAERNKVKKMNKQELINYINTWTWHKIV